MLQAANTDFVTYYYLKLTIVIVKIYYFLYKLSLLKSVKASLRIFIFCTLAYSHAYKKAVLQYLIVVCVSKKLMRHYENLFR